MRETVTFVVHFAVTSEPTLRAAGGRRAELTGSVRDGRVTGGRGHCVTFLVSCSAVLTGALAPFRASLSLSVSVPGLLHF